MRKARQLLCAVLIAVGAGLVAFSNRITPGYGLDSRFSSAAGWNGRYDDLRLMTSAMAGIGVTLMVLGALLLVMQWMEVLEPAFDGKKMSDTSARMIGTMMIWISSAFGLAMGRHDGSLVAVFSVTAICLAATVSTWILHHSRTSS